MGRAFIRFAFQSGLNEGLERETSRIYHHELVKWRVIFAPTVRKQYSLQGRYCLRAKGTLFRLSPKPKDARRVRAAKTAAGE
jgi:hypothetical protein